MLWSVGDVGCATRQQFIQLAAGPRRNNDLRQARHFLQQRVVAMHFQVFDEVLRPRRGMILGMLHRNGTMSSPAPPTCGCARRDGSEPRGRSSNC